MHKPDEKLKDGGCDLDEMINPADSPFVEGIMREKVLLKFKLDTIKQYNGSAYPIDHLDTYREWMEIYGVMEAIRFWVLYFALTGSARIWFRQFKG